MTQDRIQKVEFCVLEHTKLITRLDAQIESMEKALVLAREDMEKRLIGMNEFREELRRQAATFMTRIESDVKHEKFEGQIAELNKAKDIAEGKATMSSVYVGWILAVFGIILAIWGIVIQ